MTSTTTTYVDTFFFIIIDNSSSKGNFFFSILMSSLNEIGGQTVLVRDLPVMKRRKNIQIDQIKNRYDERDSSAHSEFFFRGCRGKVGTELSTLLGDRN
jgi:hypothetical protein